MTFSAKALGGKYVNVDENNVHALGICDLSGYVFPHSQLKKQMEWRGNQLCWTGFMVGTPFLDMPNPQNRPPPVKSDPTAVNNPRLPADYQPLSSVNLSYEQIFAQLEASQQGQPAPGSPKPDYQGYPGYPIPPNPPGPNGE
jgi:hypothetical protein